MPFLMGLFPLAMPRLRCGLLFRFAFQHFSLGGKVAEWRVCGADTMDRGPRRLLDNVSEFVSEDPLTGGRVRRTRVLTKSDVGAGREGVRPDSGGSQMRLRPRVHPHRSEVMVEARLEERA